MNLVRINLLFMFTMFSCVNVIAQATVPIRERILISDGWRFYKYEIDQVVDGLIYDVRPDVNVDVDKIAADAKPTEAVKVKDSIPVLKPYLMPTGNDFLKDVNKSYLRPAGNPGAEFSFVQSTFNDSSWEKLNLPHDWAIKGPFYRGENSPVGGGMGRLPIQGVAWYRKKLDIPKADVGKSIFLDIDGAMSYAIVWLNGHLVGGWPNGYTSWRVDLTPYLNPGGENQLAIRLDNPLSSSRWYPGGGIYRNVWLTKTSPIHVAHWGTFLKTRKVSAKSAILDLEVKIANNSAKDEHLEVATKIYSLDKNGCKSSTQIAEIAPVELSVQALGKGKVSGEVVINNPKLWFPEQHSNRYIAVTSLFVKGTVVDVYETPFGIRDVQLDAVKGLYINGKKIIIKGVNQHADLGALGMAFNERAAERQLEMLREMGCNAIRMAHNPPSPELLELTDRMGFLVIDEIFDSWERKKTPLDFHLIFPEWHEQDLRAMIRRDRNHPSVILWSFGNEVGEQYTDKPGALLAKKLHDIVKDEDSSRLTTIAMNYSKPNMPLPEVVDVIGLNYQGEGIRNAEAYAGLKGISTPPMFPAFHEKFPGKPILSTENAAAVSSRGAYLFPVYEGNSSPIQGTLGGDPKHQQVSAYELYSVDFGASADKVFATMAKHPFVAGSFVWTGWDYLGEPTPYYSSRSSYFGIIDLAGFKKDRFYLYQAQWRPELPMVHLLPHWNWPDRIGKITPVHVFTSGDEAELFLNGKSLGRKKMAEFESRLRWDEVRYEPGELKVIAYKAGQVWADETVKTTGASKKLVLSADRATIKGDGVDLSFITVKVTDENGLMVPNAKPLIKFTVDGPGEIVATDNGDATSMVSFTAQERESFNGLCLVIIRGRKTEAGSIRITASSPGLERGTLVVNTLKSE